MTIALPTKPKAPVTDIRDYTILVYGREKIGKTTLFSQWPEALFLSTEPGTKGLSIYEVSISSWKDMREAVLLLEKASGKFKTVVIDTADRAYDMCLDYVCQQMGIDYPGQDDSGREDFGRSWREVKQEFMDIVHRITRTGRGLCFTSHVKEVEFKTKGNEKYDRVFPTMGKQARSVIEALVDIFFYADYMRDSDGRTVRVLVCRGDETVFAGSRKTIGKFPEMLPLLEKGGYEVFVQGFKGEHPGVDLGKVVPARQTAPALASLSRRLRQGRAATPAPQPEGAAASTRPVRAVRRV